MITPLRKRVGLTVTVIAIVAAGSATALAMRHVSAKSVYSSFAVLKADPTATHRALRADTAPPVGSAILAGSSAAVAHLIPPHQEGLDGLADNTVVTLVAYTEGIQVYAFQASNGDLCVVGINPPGTTEYGGGGCSRSTDAATDGSGYTREALDSNPTNTMIKLVPNGVSEVTFTTRNGDSSSVPVVNNVAVYSATTSFTARFTNPKGETETSGPVIAAEGRASGAVLPKASRQLPK